MAKKKQKLVLDSLAELPFLSPGEIAEIRALSEFGEENIKPSVLPVFRPLYLHFFLRRISALISPARRDELALHYFTELRAAIDALTTAEFLNDRLILHQHKDLPVGQTMFHPGPVSDLQYARSKVYQYYLRDIKDCPRPDACPDSDKCPHMTLGPTWKERIARLGTLLQAAFPGKPPAETPASFIAAYDYLSPFEQLGIETGRSLQLTLKGEENLFEQAEDERVKNATNAEGTAQIKRELGGDRNLALFYAYWCDCQIWRHFAAIEIIPCFPQAEKDLAELVAEYVI